MKLHKILLLTLVISTSVWAQNSTIVAVGEAEVAKHKISISKDYSISKLGETMKTVADQVHQILIDNFSLYKDSFDVLETNGHTAKESEYLLKVGSSTLGGAKITLTYVNRYSADKNIEKSLSLESARNRKEIHLFADEVYQSITSKESVFLSKILFVSDRTGTRQNVKKELYIMDFDGHNKKRLTYHNALVISPAISHDGGKILYSVVRKRGKSVDLYIYDQVTRRHKLLSSLKGINSGAVFMPGDQKIVFSLSFSGNTEIYIMDLKTLKKRKLTKHYAVDVDPSISPDGTQLAFLSDRPGKAMIYLLDPTGTEKGVKRIGFVGHFNATPRFSPDGRSIAFASWLDNRFDIFRLNNDGTGLSRLTKNFGSNEDPTYSNDGQFIAFSSQKVLSRTEAIQNIYIMTKDGEILKKITSDFGKCITPRWSK